MSRKLRFKPVGKTDDNKIIVDGVFKLIDTRGIPLEIVLHVLRQNDIICCWISFWKSSINAGWNPDSTLVKIETAVSDIYGIDYCNIVMYKLKLAIIMDSL